MAHQLIDRIFYILSVFSLLAGLAGCTTTVVQPASAPRLAISPTPGPPFEKVVTLVPEGQITPEVSPTPGPVGRVTAIEDNVPIRSGPGTTFEIIGRLAKNDSAELMGLSPKNEWAQIRINGLEGWVYWSMVEVSQTNQAAPCSDGTLCPTSNGVTDEQISQVIANISALTGQKDLHYVLQEKTREPNAANYDVLVFNDENGTNYYINPETFEVVEFTWTAPMTVDAEKTKSLAELRAIAEQIANAQSVTFSAWKSKLIYTEGSKSGENTFFRWEAKGTDVGGMPGLVQIGLKQDGQIFSFMNTLDYLK